jgi:hypothetical protein
LNNNLIVLDSGASGHYLQSKATDIYEVDGAEQNINVVIPNGEIISPVCRAHLKGFNLPKSATEALVFKDDNLPNFSLMSVSVLTGAGMTVTFAGTKAVVKDHTGNCLMTADLDKSNGLFLVRSTEPLKNDCDASSKQHMSVLYPKNTTQLDRINFFSACMGSPATSTLLNAIIRGWVVFPELTAAMVRNHPHSVATDKGHLNKTRAGLDSTRTLSFSNHVSLTTLEARNTVFMDLTGRFPHVSARGMEYIMCMRCSDSNFIHVEPMKSRSARDFSAAFEKSIAFYKNHGLEHFTVKLDNETSVLFRETLKRLNMKAEFIPPDNHRQNPAERDIQTFKNHFIAILCSLPPDFPLNEWDLLLPHAEMTLNLMRPSKTTDSSSFQQLYGPYDFKRNPIAPPGTRVLVYESPEHRSSWAPMESKVSSSVRRWSTTDLFASWSRTPDASGSQTRWPGTLQLSQTIPSNAYCLHLWLQPRR